MEKERKHEREKWGVEIVRDSYRLCEKKIKKKFIEMSVSERKRDIRKRTEA